MRGRILLDGDDITDLPVHKRVRRGLSRTFQINQLFADLTPLETIGLAVSERLGRGGDWWRTMGDAATTSTPRSPTRSTRFHLLDVMNEPTATLPYGKQRLLEIALAIAAKPRVLLLDEPAAGVPESERHDILAAVAALPRDVTVLLIEHDMDLVFSFADRISVLVNGALFVEGPPTKWRATRGSRRSISARTPMADLLAHRKSARRLWRGGGIARPVAAPRGRPGAGAARPQRHRQDHADQFDRRRQPAVRRHDQPRRAGHHGVARRSAGARRHRLGAAGAQHLPLADGRGEHDRRRPAGAVDGRQTSTSCSRG